MESANGMKISITENGPYLVEGSVPLARQTIVTDDAGDSVDWRESDQFEAKDSYKLCRCGQSDAKPFCDGSHARVGFDGSETASRRPYLKEARLRRGPTVYTTDQTSLCASGRFCDPNGDAWHLVKQEGPEAARLTIRQAGLCPPAAWSCGTRKLTWPSNPHLNHPSGSLRTPRREWPDQFGSVAGYRSPAPTGRRTRFAIG